MRCISSAFVLVLALTVSLSAEEMLVPKNPNGYPHFLVHGVRQSSQCQRMVVAAATELATFKGGYPADWSLVIVCNDVAWKALLQVADQRSTYTAFTVLEKKHTIIRGDIFNLRRS